MYVLRVGKGVTMSLSEQTGQFSWN